MTGPGLIHAVRLMGALAAVGTVILLGPQNVARAQSQIMKGSIVGTVTDTQNLAVPGAAVAVVDFDRGQSFELVSGGDGHFEVYGLDPGRYRVEVRLAGFGEFESDALHLRAGQDVSLSVQLGLAGLDEQVTVTPSVEERRTDYSSPANYITAAQIASLNTPTVEDVVNYQPGVVVRRRYIGDANGTLGMRGSNMFQTARAMVFADGVPLHNPVQTRWNGAPRWSLIAPDEVESVEIVYGPFSAEHSGNAMGGVVKFNTRMPEQRQLRFDGILFGQSYDFAGADEQLGGGRFTTTYGDRFGRFSFSVLHNHLNNAGQPQNFNRDETALSPASGEPVVSGAIRGVEEHGRPAITYGDTGRDEARTDLLKFKGGYAHSPDWRSRWTLAYENRHDQGRTPRNYLLDGDGLTVWGDGDNSTRDAVLDGDAFNVRNDLFGLTDRTRESLFAAWDVTGVLGDDWMADVTVSRFSVLKDESAESNFNASDPLDDGSGAITAFDHTGWTTFDLKLRDLDFLEHDSLTFVTGSHISAQRIGLTQFDSHTWMARTRDVQSNTSGGQTSIQAVFAQLGWRLHRDWEATVGGRQEFWQSRRGFVTNTRADLAHPDRDISAFSPKASVGWEPADRFRLQYSIARAHRFPVVEELFDNELRTFGTVLGDARLDPEEGLHHNLSLQQGVGDGHIEVNLFRDEVKGTIFTQFQFVQGAPIFSFLPIDQVDTTGVEVVFDQRHLFDSKIDIQVNTTFTDAEIVQHDLQPSNEGNVFPRMPKVRVGLFGVYHVSPRWLTSLGVRYSSNQFGDLNNSDTVDNVFGAMDPYVFLDLKLRHQLVTGGTLSFGINNVTNESAFVHHPWPQRTFFAEYSVDVLDDLLSRR